LTITGYLIDIILYYVLNTVLWCHSGGGACDSLPARIVTHNSVCFLILSIISESEESVLADLTWLGLIWDEGPDMPQRSVNLPAVRNARGAFAAQRTDAGTASVPCFVRRKSGRNEVGAGSGG
jgi:hypothetical protein